MQTASILKTSRDLSILLSFLWVPIRSSNASDRFVRRRPAFRNVKGTSFSFFLRDGREKGDGTGEEKNDRWEPFRSPGTPRSSFLEASVRSFLSRLSTVLGRVDVDPKRGSRRSGVRVQLLVWVHLCRGSQPSSLPSTRGRIFFHVFHVASFAEGNVASEYSLEVVVGHGWLFFDRTWNRIASVTSKVTNKEGQGCAVRLSSFRIRFHECRSGHSWNGSSGGSSSEPDGGDRLSIRSNRENGRILSPMFLSFDHDCF